jgi:uncharacterized protein
MRPDDGDWITSAEELAALYPSPSRRAVLKQIDRLDDHCRTIISASPFFALSTCDAAGADCSPRGERPGFVHVLDDRRLAFPDRRGNNRLDSLRNILENPEVGMLFLVPGVHETLRVNGSARISTSPALLGRFTEDDPHPRCVVVVEVREAFIQCSRALVRAGLWDPTRFLDRAALPSLGTILSAHTGGLVDAEAYDREREGDPER